MKRLYLIRHAKSSWKYPELTDFDRPLNKRGERNAPFMGKRLNRYGIKPDIMISSPAKRALRTARIIAGEINFPIEKLFTDDSIYLGSAGTLLSVIRNIDDVYHQVFLYGHNPGFTQLANYLTNYRIANIPTCGIVGIDFNLNSWIEVTEGKGIFVFFDYPKKHG